MSIVAQRITTPHNPAGVGRTVQNARELSNQSLLWRSVLSQAVKDIYGTDAPARLEVIRWVKTKDFDTICDFACVEATAMRDQMLALLTMPIQLAKKYGKPLSDMIMCNVHKGE